MNKSFKVLWNKIRAQHVVTDEHKHAHGKGKTKSLLMTQPSISFLAMGSTLAMILAPPFAQATTITPGWSNTTVTTANGVTNITTNVSSNGTGINKFEQFDVSARDIANLHINTNDTRLLNLVKNDVTINGVVNAVQAAAPTKLAKGEVMFVTPKGLMVGSTGVINAGSFTAVTTTQAQFDQYYSKSAEELTAGALTSAQVDDISKGEIPINPNGVITINGSINVANQVMVAAGTVNVGETGKVTTGVTDFTQLVNVPASESASLGAVDSGLSADGLMLVEDNVTGDVTLISRVEGTLVGTHTSTENQGTEPVDPQAVSDSITVNEVRAKVAVADGATIEATGKVAIEAAAGAGAYEKGTRTTMGLGQTEVRTRFKATKDMESFDVGADVQVNGTVKGKSVQVRSVADNRLDHSLGFNLSTAKDMLGGLLPSGLTDLEGETVDSTTTSKLTLGSTARIEALEDAAVQSYADTDINISEGSTWKSFIQFPGDSYMPIVNVVKLKADSQATTTTKGQIIAGKSVDVHSGNRLRADVTAQSATGNTDQPQGAAVIAKLSGGASTVHNASIQGTDPEATTLTDVSITSRQDSDVVTKADVGVPKQGRFGLAVNVTQFDTNAKTTINAPVEVKANTLTIASENITDTLKTLATVDVGDTTLFMKVKSKLLTPVTKLATVANLNGGKPTADQSTSRFQAGGALNVTRNAQDATVEVNRSLTNTGAITVNAKSELSDHHYRATAKQEVQNADDNGDASTAKYSGTLAISINTATAEDRQAASSNIYVADGADILSGTSTVTLTNTAAIEKERYKELLEDITDIYNELKDIQESDPRFDAGAAKVKEGARLIKESFENDPIWRDVRSDRANDPNDAGNASRINALKLLFDGINELIAAGGDLTVAAAPKVMPFGFALVDLVNPAAHGNLYVSAGGKTSKAAQDVTMLAGGVGIANQDTASRLVIGKHSQISGTDITLNTTSRNENIAIAGLTDTFLGIPLPQMTRGSAIGGNFVMQSLGTDNLLLVSEDAQLQGTGAVKLKAEDAIDAYGVSFGLGINKGDAMIAGLATVTRSDGHNRLFIDDESRIQGLTVAANAFRDDNFVTVAGQLGLNKSSGSGTTIGAGVGVVLGGVTNELTIGDFDAYSDRGDAEGGTSADDYLAGYIASTSATDGLVDLTAHHELDMNTVGLAAMLSNSNQQSEETGGETGGETGTQTGGETGAQPGSSTGTQSGSNGITDSASVDKSQGGIEKVIDMVEEFVPDAGAGAPVKAALKSDLMAKLQSILQKIRGIEEKANNVVSQNQDTNFGEGGKKLMTSNKMSQPSIAGGSSSGSTGEAGSGGVRITGAGGFAWNDFDSTNTTTVSSTALKSSQGVFTIRTEPTTPEQLGNRVQIAAMTDHWQWALSGAGAIGKAKDASLAASLAGAVAVNKGITNNRVTIEGLKVENPTELHIGSLTEGSLLAEGLGMTVASGGKSSLGFTGGVSYNATESTVQTDVTGLVYDSGDVPGAYYQLASASDQQITGGTGIGVASGSQNAAAIGASIAIADMKNTIDSQLVNSTLTKVNRVNVEALTRLDQINTAIGVQVAKGQNAVALNGSFIQSDIANAVRSAVRGSAINLTAAGGMNVVASDGDATEFLAKYALAALPVATHTSDSAVTLKDDIGNSATITTEVNREDGSVKQTLSIKDFLNTTKSR
ncbi:MAG: leukotoxin LktA family filamentous adhesin [Sutterella sp.]|nr:leukotoxin LktA family filamentous adhesin [Sutterella sp.]